MSDKPATMRETRPGIAATRSLIVVSLVVVSLMVGYLVHKGELTAGQRVKTGRLIRASGRMIAGISARGLKMLHRGVSAK
jgi:hypothetical protein